MSILRRKPNILIIITHDTGRHLGCYGRGVETPNLDGLAKEGILFTNAFCTAPQCSPSRAGLQTGMYPHSNGMIGLAHRGFKLNKNVPLLPKIFSENGYSTYLFGHQHETIHKEENIKKLGYQKVIRGDSDFSKDVVPLVKEFLDSKPDCPFFASVGFVETHRKYPELKDSKEADNVKVPPYLEDVPDIRKDIAELNIMVRDVDNAVKQILESLEKSGQKENTIVIFTTDHGIAFPGAKATLFDPGIEVSLIMRGPFGFTGGKTIDGLCSTIDIFPTLLETCGIDIPKQVQGFSLLPLVTGKTNKIREEIFTEQTFHAAYDPIRSIRTEKYKYIRNYEKRPFWFPPNVDSGSMGGYTKEWYRQNHPEVFKMDRPSEFLFDLVTDPLEKNNLIGSKYYSEIQKGLKERLEKWMESTGDVIMKECPVKLPEGCSVTSPDSWEP
jgi:arylsulfatase A-like enzyme